MFDIERWQEIFDTIRKNKLRTFLTGISVASGIFILVILLGFGQGMQNGIEQEFEQDAATSVWVWPGVTSKEFKGMNTGRRIQLNNENYNNSVALFKESIQYDSPRIFLRGITVNYGKESLVYSVQGVAANFQFIENAKMIDGRFINYLDEKAIAKVAIIGKKIRTDVFNEVKTPIGEYIDISGIPFKIIGVCKEYEDREEERIYIPITTAQRVFNGGDRVNNMSYTLPPTENFDQAVAQAIDFKERLKSYLQQALSCNSRAAG